MVQAGRSEMYFAAFSDRLTPTDGSLRVKIAGTSSHRCVFVNILTETLGFVKRFYAVCSNPSQWAHHAKAVGCFGVVIAAVRKTE